MCSRSSRGQASTACRSRQRWYEWRPGRHSSCPAAGTRCSHVRCGPGVVFFRSDQSGVKTPVLEVFDYCRCDFTCVFVHPEEKENHFPMQEIDEVYNLLYNIVLTLLAFQFCPPIVPLICEGTKFFKEFAKFFTATSIMVISPRKRALSA